MGPRGALNSQIRSIQIKALEGYDQVMMNEMLMEYFLIIKRLKRYRKVKGNVESL